MREAARVFRSVEAQCPTELGLEALAREEIWDALFRSHRQNATTSPELPDTPGLDIRDYTCAESIEGTGWFLMHGSYPVAVVSAFVPPQPVITAASGEGKSVTGARIINTCLTQIPHLKVSAIDYKRSLGPLAETLHARDIEFDEKNLRALNDWYYPGLFEGVAPDKVQLSFVEGSIRLLGSVEKTDVIGRSVVKTIVEEVYKIAVGRNGKGLPEFEPTLTSFLNVLKK